ncbi:hypothetical protein JK358_12470 [Nocardia sp. 2]|uniref:Outer membrane channel protein CpnT-like N-terminal domain-containing protein n=1 Tax=Nocardia acididurans TaxID=2802282 RepID=A0ABS1M3H3_9NOCA|nr:hypothetical protein [Nocardia acididurans]MBL1075207.1 hypothetical protein [Nocardia acididurans]
MGDIEFPESLEWVGWLVGMEWPDGSESGMWALAQDWHTAAEGLRQLLPAIDDAKYATLAAYPEGRGIEEMSKLFDALRGVGGGGEESISLPDLAKYFDDLGDSAYSTGTEIEYTKLMFYSSLALAAAEILAAWIWPPTAPAVQAVIVAATRIAVRIIGRRAATAIAQHAARMAGAAVVRFLLRHVAIDFTLGTAQEIGIQQYQVSTGKRKEINWDQVAVTAISSAAGGAAAGPFGDWLGNKLARKGIDGLLGNAITGGAAGLVGAGAGFVAGTGAQFGIDVYRDGWDQAVENLANTPLDPRMLTSGGFNGAASGASHGAARRFYGPAGPGGGAGPNVDPAGSGGDGTRPGPDTNGQQPGESRPQADSGEPGRDGATDPASWAGMPEADRNAPTTQPAAAPAGTTTMHPPPANGPSATAPVSSAPGSPAPVSSAPGSPAPVSSAPGSPAPVSNAPGSPAPVSNAPSSSAPVSNAPASSTPVSGSPSSPASASNTPSASTPASNSPGSSQPSGSSATSDAEGESRAGAPTDGAIPPNADVGSSDQAPGAGQPEAHPPAAGMPEPAAGMPESDSGARPHGGVPESASGSTMLAPASFPDAGHVPRADGIIGGDRDTAFAGLPESGPVTHAANPVNQPAAAADSRGPVTDSRPDTRVGSPSASDLTRPSAGPGPRPPLGTVVEPSRVEGAGPAADHRAGIGDRTAGPGAADPNPSVRASTTGAEVDAHQPSDSSGDHRTPHATTPDDTSATPVREAPDGAPAVPVREAPDGAPAVPVRETSDGAPAVPVRETSDGAPVVPARETPDGAPTTPVREIPDNASDAPAKQTPPATDRGGSPREPAGDESAARDSGLPPQDAPGRAEGPARTDLLAPIVSPPPAQAPGPARRENGPAARAGRGALPDGSAPHPGRAGGGSQPGSDSGRAAGDPERLLYGGDEPPADDWSALSPEEVADELERRFADREPHGLLVDGFDESMHPDVAREIARAVEFVLSQYPEIDLRRVAIDRIGDRNVYAHAEPNAVHPHTDRIVFNRRHATNPVQFARRVAADEANGDLVPGSGARPVYSTIVHELAHALDSAADMVARDRAWDALLDHFEVTRGVQDWTDPDTLREFDDFVRELSGYSFDDNDIFEPTEALAEAFTDVEMNGENASEAAQVLHRVLVDAAREFSGGQNNSQVDGGHRPSEPAERRGAGEPEPSPGDEGGRDGGENGPPNRPPATPSPDDPDGWFDRMRAEQADWEARMDAERAQWLRGLADQDPSDTPDARTARFEADNAEWLARMARERADWLWDMAGGRPEGGEPLQPAAEPTPDAGTTPDNGTTPDAGTTPDNGSTPNPDADTDAVRDRYDELLQQRKELARELEFWRAKRDARIGRLLDGVDPETALGTREALAQTILRLYDRLGIQTVDISSAGDEGAQQVRESLSPDESARRREALRKLVDAAERVHRLDEQLGHIDRELRALEQTGEIGRRPLPEEVRAEHDRLARERAGELVEIKPVRQERDALAARFGLADSDGTVNESALSPERLPATMEELRTTHPDDPAVADLRRAADEVNLAHNRIGRLQDEMERVSAAYRQLAEAEGARMITDRVAIADGDPRRIIVYGPRDELVRGPDGAVRPRPNADLDRALAQALDYSAAVAQAMVDPATRIEYRQVHGDRNGTRHVVDVPPPTVDRLISPPRKGIRFNSTRWRDGDGNWHPVDPTRPDWVTNREGVSTPKKFEGRDLPEGVSGWAVDRIQAAVVDVFVDPAPGQPNTGVNKDLLPHIPGGKDPATGGVDTYTLPFADAAGHIMRVILEVAKLSGFTWYSDSEHPGRIAPGFKGHPMFRSRPGEVQPMVREYLPAEHADDNGELSEPFKQRRQMDAERWARVQAWADSEYQRFRADDSDIDVIADNLAAHRTAQDAGLTDFIQQVRDELAARPDAHPADILLDLIFAGPDITDDARDMLADLRRQMQDFPSDERAALAQALVDGLAAAAADLIPPEFTPEQIAQIKDHLMRDPHLVLDPVTGELTRATLDAVADVAEAWNRLIAGNPLPSDLLLLQDALAESNFLRDNPDATWSEANAHVASQDGFHWDAARPPLTGDRAGVRYEPAPLPPDHPRPVPSSGTGPAALNPATPVTANPGSPDAPNSGVPDAANSGAPDTGDSRAPAAVDSSSPDTGKPGDPDADDSDDPDGGPDEPDDGAPGAPSSGPPQPPHQPPAAGPDTWFDRMQAEQADWAARMDAERAAWLHQLADEQEPGSVTQQLARLEAGNADIQARFSASHAENLWQQVGSRAESPAPARPTGPATPAGPPPTNPAPMQPDSTNGQHSDPEPEANLAVGKSDSSPHEPAAELSPTSEDTGTRESPDYSSLGDSAMPGDAGRAAPEPVVDPAPGESETAGPVSDEPDAVGRVPRAPEPGTGEFEDGPAAGGDRDPEPDADGRDGGDPRVDDEERPGRSGADTAEWQSNWRSHMPRVPRDFEVEFPDYTPEPPQRPEPWTPPPDLREPPGLREEPGTPSTSDTPPSRSTASPDRTAPGQSGQRPSSGVMPSGQPDLSAPPNPSSPPDLSNSPGRADPRGAGWPDMPTTPGLSDDAALPGSPGSIGGLPAAGGVPDVTDASCPTEPAVSDPLYPNESNGLDPESPGGRGTAEPPGASNPSDPFSGGSPVGAPAPGAGVAWPPGGSGNSLPGPAGPSLNGNETRSPGGQFGPAGMPGMGAPMAPPAAGGPDRQGRERQRFPRASAPAAGGGGGVYLRAHAGYGEYAVLDPVTGLLSAVPSPGAVSGVYGDMDGVPVAFYRDQTGLVVRVGQQVFDVDRMGADSVWEAGRDFARFVLRAGGNILCELRYRPLSVDADLGLLIRDVLADPLRRAGIFG